MSETKENTASYTKAGKKVVRKQVRAGLTLPITRINNIMKRTCGTDRVGSSAPVYMSALLEYLITEIVDGARVHTEAAKRKRVFDRDITLSIRTDPDLAKVCGSFVVYTGNNIVGIREALKPGLSKAKNVQSVDEEN